MSKQTQRLARILLSELEAEKWCKDRAIKRAAERRAYQASLPFYKRKWFILKVSIVVGVILALGTALQIYLLYYASFI